MIYIYIGNYIYSAHRLYFEGSRFRIDAKEFRSQPTDPGTLDQTPI